MVRDRGYTPTIPVARVVPTQDPKGFRLPSMTYVDMAIVAGLGLLLLFTLVAFGVGHKRWSMVSVVAAFLVALTIPTYLYFAAQLLHHEWRWAQLARSLEQKIARVRDAQEPSAAPERGGSLEKIDGMPSIEELRQSRDRWERALTRVDNWRGRYWDKATFAPPPADGQPGTITLAAVSREPAPAAAEPAAAGDIPAGEGDIPPPAAATAIDPGATVYVFDDKPVAADGGGKYLGAFLVQAVATVDGRQELTVQQTAPRDAYDTKAWGQAYESVSVYTELPNDRWLVYTETRGTPAGEEPAEDDAKIAPPPVKRGGEAIDELVPEHFRQQVKDHALTATSAPEAIDQAQWPDLRAKIASGEVLPGEYWAEVTFTERLNMEEFFGDRAGSLGKDTGLSIEMDLATAFELGDAGKLAIDKVFYRRPLVDGLTLLHGTALPGNDDKVTSDGLAELRLVLEREITALQAAKLRLDTSLAKARGELEILDTQKGQFKDDLTKWERDVAESTRLAERFEAEAKAFAARLTAAEEQVVALGKTYVEEIRKAVQEVDRAAPTAGRTDATAF